MQIEIIQKAFDETVLENVSFRIVDDGITVLFGPSGCGKSTLVNLIAQLDQNFQGHIDAPGHSPKIGVVFQEPRLLPWLSVRQNIALVCDNNTAEQNEKITKLLDELDLSTVADRLGVHLSLGMARRVALGRALVIDPDMLILDEPFVSLDQPVAKKLRDLVMQIQYRRKGRVLLVTHDLEEAVRLADQIIFLGGKPTRVLDAVALLTTRSLRHSTYVENKLADLKERYSSLVELRASPMKLKLSVIE